ncbi:NUDIX domain-containing protein [Candidatus Saccharibacteria bacterium]|nr:NUDIX domain-containing protein [Candidatus Saccharibacteria bacterium]
MDLDGDEVYTKHMTKSSKFKLPVIVLLLLTRDKEVLLMRRQNTGWGDGSYDLVAGHVDGQESLQVALAREALEEVNITISQDDVEFMHLLHYVGETEYMYVFFKAEKWRGTPKIMETEKCDDLRWFPLSELPDNLLPITRDVLHKYKNNVPYSSIVIH